MEKDENQKSTSKAVGDGEVIERTIFIEAPPEVVIDFLLKPELLARWLGRSRAREPKPGDPFCIEFLHSGYTARGDYRDVSPPHRVAFTWGWEGHEDFPPGTSLVEIELVPHAGGTFLRLRYSGLPRAVSDELSPISHGEHWQQYRARLQSLAPA